MKILKVIEFIALYQKKTVVEWQSWDLNTDTSQLEHMSLLLITRYRNALNIR